MAKPQLPIESYTFWKNLSTWDFRENSLLFPGKFYFALEFDPFTYKLLVGIIFDY
jgi:hypothetical protein